MDILYKVRRGFMRILKIYYEYDSLEELKQHENELFKEGLECINYHPDYNIIGKPVYIGQYVNMKYE
jgi:hypothetical protein